MIVDSQSQDVIAFDHFRLHPSKRLLERDGAPVALVGRALDILIVLAERAGEIVSKKVLIDRVWPDVTVDEGSLRFHMVTLRKALGEGQDGARFVTTVPGRGYSFVAPSTRTSADPSAPSQGLLRDAALPAKLSRMVGRDAIVGELSALLLRHRIVTLVGPGGIGKTTAAIAVGHLALPRYQGAVHFIDLAGLNELGLVESAVAATLGLRVQSNDIAAALISFLRERPMLLVLDNCEHVVETVARLCEQIFEQAPGVAILTTSREALRVEGERVYPLPALEVPPEDAALSAVTIMDYPAAQLFIERTTAGGVDFPLSDAQAPLIAEICRKLDGMALAIELAAGRVGAYGLQGVSDLLDSRMRLLWRGRRTAPARQHTLAATLDWSYNLLSETERRVLDRFSIFVGACDLAAAMAVVCDDELDSEIVLEAIAGLVAKSLLTSHLHATGVRYRLLQTTRAYVRSIAAGHEDLAALSRRHALYFATFLSARLAETPAQQRGFAFDGELLGNLRAALQWTFSPDGDGALRATLGAAAAGVFLELSLLGECEVWCQRTIDTLDETTRGSEAELHLQAAYALSLMFTRGNTDEVRAALHRGLELCQTWDDGYRELPILGVLNTFQTRVCEFVGAVDTARRSERVARRIGDPAAIAMAEFMLGVSLQGAGDQGAAEAYCEAAILASPTSGRLDAAHLGYDHRLRALMALARCLWLQGRTRRGLALLGDAMSEAEALGDPVTLNIVMMYTAPVCIWMQQWEQGEALIARQIAHAEKHGLGPYKAVGIGLSGELAMRRGRPEIGVPLLRASLEQLRIERHHWWFSTFLSALAEGSIQLGEFQAARAAMGEAVEHFERDGETWYTAELLRTAAHLALVVDAAPVEAEALLQRSIVIAARQTACIWELRATFDLAKLTRDRGDAADRREALAAVLDKLDDEQTVPDVLAAREWLER